MNDPTHRYLGCTCEAHSSVYADWPWTNVELTIASCMRSYPYCGGAFMTKGNLRTHLKGEKYRRRNITIRAEKHGRRGVM